MEKNKTQYYIYIYINIYIFHIRHTQRKSEQLDKNKHSTGSILVDLKVTCSVTIAIISYFLKSEDKVGVNAWSSSLDADIVFLHLSHPFDTSYLIIASPFILLRACRWFFFLLRRQPDVLLRYSNGSSNNSSIITSSSISPTSPTEAGVAAAARDSSRKIWDEECTTSSKIRKRKRTVDY